MSKVIEVVKKREKNNLEECKKNIDFNVSSKELYKSKSNIKLRNTGITLIALIITIIILLILAGVAIHFTLGENGIINISEKSGEKYNKQEATESINLKITNSQIKAYGKNKRMPTLQELANDFCEDEDIQYVELESKKTASLEKIQVGESNSIFTKLKQYPYEFEINGNLQLASIDGVRIATTDTVTIPKEEYEELKNKVENLGQSYEVNYTITFDKTNTWTDLPSVKFKIPKGTWLIDVKVGSLRGSAGIFAWEISGIFGDSYWKSDNNYNIKHFSGIITINEEKESYLRYYKSINDTTSTTFGLRAIKVAE